MSGSYPRGRRHGEVVHELGRAIVSGELPAGGPLGTEEELAAKLGVGRGALREAVKVLAAKGLVVSKTRTGTVVQSRDRWNLMDPDVLAWRYQGSPSPAELSELAQVRIALEPEAARLAGEAATEADLARIEAAYGRMVAALREPDEFITADLEFHQAVFLASGNDLLVTMFQLLGVAFAEVRQVHTRSLRRNQQTLPDHEAVLIALRERDGDRAAALMRTVVTEAAHDVRKARRRRAAERDG